MLGSVWIRDELSIWIFPAWIELVMPELPYLPSKIAAAQIPVGIGLLHLPVAVMHEDIRCAGAEDGGCEDALHPSRAVSAAALGCIHKYHIPLFPLHFIR